MPQLTVDEIEEIILILINYSIDIEIVTNLIEKLKNKIREPK
jgi:hypothetical protein